jgi:hypothetical protein
VEHAGRAVIRQDGGADIAGAILLARRGEKP